MKDEWGDWGLGIGDRGLGRIGTHVAIPAGALTLTLSQKERGHVAVAGREVAPAQLPWGAMTNGGCCHDGNLGLRRAGLEGSRRKWWWGEGLRGAGAEGGRRKSVIAGTHQKIRVALMANWDASCWEVGGCEENGEWPIGHTSCERWGLAYMLPAVSASLKPG